MNARCVAAAARGRPSSAHNHQGVCRHTIGQVDQGVVERNHDVAYLHPPAAVLAVDRVIAASVTS